MQQMSVPWVNRGLPFPVPDPKTFFEHVGGQITMTENHTIIGRVRINVSTSVKGVKTYDCTVETASQLMPDGTLMVTDIDPTSSVA